MKMIIVNRLLYILTIACFLFLLSCGHDGDVSEPIQWNLSGTWEVTDHFWEGDTYTYEIKIEQTGESVIFLRDSETISNGTIANDSIQCTDWNGLGIGSDSSKIYIIDEDSMTCTPLVEAISYITFSRIT